MQKGVSIFYESHEQGLPHIIAGIYSPRMMTEEEMRNELLSLLGYSSFGRDEPIFVNHTHVYAKHLLGEEIDEELFHTFSKFFPDAKTPDKLPVSPFTFQYYDAGAYNFIWDNRYHNELREHRNKLMKEAADKYREERASRRVPK